MADPNDIEKDQGCQVSISRKPSFSRGNRVTLYTALITALGALLTTVIPAVVDMFSNKPSTEQVQVMIASQAEKLTVELNKTIDAVKGLDKRLIATQEALAKLQGSAGSMEGVLQTCCYKTAVNALPVVAAPPKPAPKPEPAPASETTTGLKSTLKLDKVPEMKIDVQAD